MQAGTCPSAALAHAVTATAPRVPACPSADTMPRSARKRSFGHYPYPLDSEGKPIDTPEWRDGSDIKKFANPTDNDLIKAVRNDDKDPEAVDRCLAAGADINAKDKVRRRSPPARGTALYLIAWQGPAPHAPRLRPAPRLHSSCGSTASRLSRWRSRTRTAS